MYLQDNEDITPAITFTRPQISGNRTHSWAVAMIEYLRGGVSLDELFQATIDRNSGYALKLGANWMPKVFWCVNVCRSL